MCLIVLPIFVVDLLPSRAPSLRPELLTRCKVQAFSVGGGGMSLGTGVINDVYPGRPENRGPAAFAARYASRAWRGAVLLLPETSWPNACGIDKLREAVALLLPNKHVASVR